MDERLLSAVKLAESVRYPGDRGRDLERGEQLESSRIHYHFNQAGLRLSRELTPGTYGVLEQVCIRLKIEPGDVLAYVHASPEIQARCAAAHFKTRAERGIAKQNLTLIRHENGSEVDPRQKGSAK